MKKGTDMLKIAGIATGLGLVAVSAISLIRGMDDDFPELVDFEDLGVGDEIDKEAEPAAAE